MTQAQSDSKGKLRRKRSKLSARMAELSAKAEGGTELTADEQTEYVQVRAKYDRASARLDAEPANGTDATTETRAEADPEITDHGETQHAAETRAAGDGEAAEVRALREKVDLPLGYLAPALAGTQPVGAAAEYAAAVGARLPELGGVVVPWSMLEPAQRAAAETSTEDRAATTTANVAGGQQQRLLSRVFEQVPVLATMGATIEQVGAGQREYKLLSAGVTPADKAESATIADSEVVAVTFSDSVLKPRRLTGQYEMTVEAGGLTPELQEFISADLRAAIAAGMSSAIVNSDGLNSTPSGLLAQFGAPTDPGAVATYTDMVKSPALAVDGMHASRENQVSILMGIESYQLAAGLHQAGSGESATEALGRRSRAVSATSYIPDPDASTHVQAAFLHAREEAGRMDLPVAVWDSGVELIVDRVTKARTGQVVLTFVALWNFAIVRTAAYRRVAFQVE